MKQKTKTIYTPNKSFECKVPLDWDNVARNLTMAVNRYNKVKRKEWQKASIIRRIFTRPATYRVVTESAGVSEMMKLYPGTNHHQIWIENVRNKRMHFDLLCWKQSFTNSKFLQDGVKYSCFLLISEDTSIRWLDKKHTFLYELLPFIQYEVS